VSPTKRKLGFDRQSRPLLKIIYNIPLPSYAPTNPHLLNHVIAPSGMFIDAVSIMMITIPVFFPIVSALGFSPLRFDQARTKLHQNKLFLTTGDRLLSKFFSPMMTIVEDTYREGTHDLGCGMGSRTGYQRLYENQACQELQSKVIDKGLCTFCGGCVGTCPYLVAYKGRIIVRDMCDLPEGHCSAVCPRFFLDLDEISQAIFGGSICLG